LELLRVIVERTLSIIKPDGTEKNIIGDILNRFEKAGLRIAGLRLTKLTKAQAQEFYAVHKERPFYGELCDYMSNGTVVVSVLEGPDAVAVNRKLMGATDPKKADKGTIRADHAESIGRNVVHGSDSKENAAIEVRFFFPELA
jgi:nucleoside-diphosphate kinase